MDFPIVKTFLVILLMMYDSDCNSKDSDFMDDFELKGPWLKGL